MYLILTPHHGPLDFYYKQQTFDSTFTDDISLVGEKLGENEWTLAYRIDSLNQLIKLEIPPRGITLENKP